MDKYSVVWPSLLSKVIQKLKEINLHNHNVIWSIIKLNLSIAEIDRSQSSLLIHHESNGDNYGGIVWLYI